jgi:type VI secretion system secreted protein VgrG
MPFISSTSPVLEDLMFWRIVGHETLSRPSVYELTVLSKKDDILPKEILGHDFMVTLDFLDKAGAKHQRQCQGFATRFRRMGEVGRYFSYQISFQSWFGLLRKRTNSRILQESTVLDAVDLVVDDSPVKRVKKINKDDVLGKHKPHDYCVQYQETDYSFLSRLFEEEGIYYWFDTHGEEPGTMHLSDTSDSVDAKLPVNKVMHYVPSGSSEARFNEITRWTQYHQLDNGIYDSRDTDFKAIKKVLKAEKMDFDDHEMSDLEVFEAVGGYRRTDDTEAIGTMRMEELASRRKRYWAETSWPDVAAGMSFDFENDSYPLSEGEYLISSCTFVVSHPGYEGIAIKEEIKSVLDVLAPAISDDAVNAQMQTEFRQAIDNFKSLRIGVPGTRAFLLTVLPKADVYRVPRLTPMVTMPGPQSAIVVGPEGEEIHTDEFGRVKVHFHWDRYDESNEKSTAYLRVSQPWAGKAWGGYFIPRIGQEVIVDFLNGDPDRPIVMGRVYNDNQPIPYHSPTQSGFKTRSTPNGTPSNYNEIMFEDKKGSENINIHAERNMSRSVEVNDSSSIGNDQSDSVTNNREAHVGKNETTHVGVNQINFVDVSQTNTIGAGGQTTHVKGPQNNYIHSNQLTLALGDQTIATNSNQSIVVKGFQKINVGNNQDNGISGYQTTKVGLDHALLVGGNTKIQTTGVRNDVTSAKHNLMANEISMLSNTNLSLMAAGNIDSISIGSNTTVLGSNSSGYIGSSSEANIGMSRSTFMGLSMSNAFALDISNFLGIQIENTAAVRLENIATAWISSSTIDLDMQTMKIINPGSGAAGAGAAAGGAGMIAGFVIGGLAVAAGIYDVTQTMDQYRKAAEQLQAASNEAASQGLTSLSRRLADMSALANRRVYEGTVMAVGGPFDFLAAPADAFGLTPASSVADAIGSHAPSRARESGPGATPDTSGADFSPPSDPVSPPMPDAPSWSPNPT